MIFGIVTFLLICSFCYYIPRMIFFRISRFSQDRQNPNFFLIILLSCIAVIGAIVHILAVADGISQWVESMKLLFAMKFESENQNNHEMIFYYLKVSFNRLVTPIVAIYLIQQIVLNTNYLPKKYFNLTVQATLSAICASLIFSYSIQNFAEEASKIDDSFHFKPDPLPSFLDIIPPVIAISLFFVAKKTLKRSTTYLDRSNPSSSTTIDFVSKVITWQTIMLIFTSFSYFTSLSDPVASFFSEAILSQHSPMIHYVLLRSLLRARKSTRFCCLLICCTDDEKVADLSTIEKRNRLPPVKQNNGIQIDNKDKNDLGQDSLEEKTKNN